MEAALPDRILAVDLDDGTVAVETLPAAWTANFLGGKGLGARYLYEAVGASVDPLSAENVLLFMVGPLTGYLPDGGRVAAITKSPLTGLFLDSYAGGSVGPALRAWRPDVAGIAIRGRCAEQHVLDLRPDSPQLDPVPELAGGTVSETDAAFPDAAVASVGPAGETGVAFATIAIDGGDHHAGRGGAGAVMGTKGLKALVLDEGVPSVPTPEMAAVRERTRAAFADSPYGRSYRSTGTLDSVEFADALSILPTRGWQDRTFAGASAIGAEAVAATATGRERGDEEFPGDYRLATGEDQTVVRGGAPIALGAGLGIDDVEAVGELAATCDRLGLDVISAGNALALAVRAGETGAIEHDVAFGDPDGALELLDAIAHGRGGDARILGRGVEAAATKWDLPELIPTVKAMAVPSFDPRGAPAMALAYATSDRGACHRRAVPATVGAFRPQWTPTQIAGAVAAEQDRRAVLWCLIVDDVTAPMLGDLGRAWLDALGHPTSAEELRHIGARTWTMTRLFNVREGVDRSADSLPAVFREGAAGIDPSAFERMVDRYYERREWDRAGRPSERLMARLDLLELCDADTPIGDPPLRSSPVSEMGGIE